MGLSDLEIAAQAAAEVLRPEVVDEWLHAPNPWLKGFSPADFIADGQLDLVLGMIAALAEGVTS